MCSLDSESIQRVSKSKCLSVDYAKLLIPYWRNGVDCLKYGE